MPHTLTEREPFDIVFGEKATEVRQIRPFGCCAEFLRPIKKLVTFSFRTKNVFSLFHEGGGIYRTEKSNVNVRNRHFKLIKSKSPCSTSDSDFDFYYAISSETDSDSNISLTISRNGISESGDIDYDDDFDTNEEEGDSDSDSSEDYEQSRDSDIESKNIINDDEEQIISQYLTYISLKPSNLRMKSDSSDTKNDCKDSHSSGLSGHNLRPKGKFNYSMAALPNAITTNNEPKNRNAFSPPKQAYWIVTIDEELHTLIENKKWVSGKEPPVSVKVLERMIILKLKREENGRLENFKSRLVTLGNLQDVIQLLIELYEPLI